MLDQDPDGVAGPPGARASTPRSAPPAPSRSPSAAGTAASCSSGRRRDAILCASAPRARLGNRARRPGGREPVAGRADRPGAAHAVDGVARAREIVVVTGRPDLPSNRCSSFAGAAAPSPSSSWPPRPSPVARGPAARPPCARRRRACSSPSSAGGRSPRLSPGDKRRRERSMASARGAGRRLLAAALPVAAISFAWGSLEVDAKTGSSPASPRSRSCAVPARMAARIAVAVGSSRPHAPRRRTTAHDVRRIVDRG